MSAHVLLARLDSHGDVLLTGPAVRAVAARARRVTMLVGRRGRAAAELLPGVDDIREYRAAWIDPEPEPISPRDTASLLRTIAGLSVDEAIIFTSYHQSALPLALLFRLAGVRVIAAISEDYPGSLLDVRHRVPEDIHEVERALSLVATLGYRLPEGDDGALIVNADRAGGAWTPPWPRYVVVHPGASVPARAWAPEKNAALVDLLAGAGHCVVVTGGPEETALTARVAGRSRDRVMDRGGALDFAGLARVLAAADVVVVGNTGPAHLAAAVGTPVVSLFAPTVPATRWRPWRVPHVLLGQQSIECSGCRVRRCPVPGHPCLGAVRLEDVLHAVESLRRAPRTAPAFSAGRPAVADGRVSAVAVAATTAPA